jgi:tetratricopeptide (TPR) repeat protein
MMSSWLPHWLKDRYVHLHALRELNRLQRREDESLVFAFTDEIDNALIAFENGLPKEAQRRWAEIRQKYFNNAIRSGKSFRLLTKLQCFDEAEELANIGRRRFPREAFYLEQLAEIANQRGNGAEAVRRWAVAQKAFPERPASYIRGAICLRDQGKPDEGTAMLQRAQRKFPYEFEAWLEDARFAEHHGDWAGAVSRWEKLRINFPQHLVCTTGLARCLERLGRADESEALLEAAKIRFPLELSLWADLAWSAHRRADWPLAAARWQMLRKRFPMLPLGYVAGASALRALGLTEEIDAVLSEAVDRLPDESGIALDHAMIPQKRNDWTLAVTRWEEFRIRFPDREEGYLRGADALRAIGRNSEAEQIIAQYTDRPVVPS